VPISLRVVSLTATEKSVPIYSDDRLRAFCVVSLIFFDHSVALGTCCEKFTITHI